MRIKQPIVIAGLLAAALCGCASSTMGPGSGAAEAPVKGSVDAVNKHAQNVFQQMNIQTTGSSTSNYGNERQLTGKLGDSNITVKIDKQDDNTSSVKVDASKNFVQGQSNIAKDILNKIVSQS